MARTLETLDLGTPVFCGETRVGTVSGLYAEGHAKSVEWVVVSWADRGDLAVPATEVEDIADRGVVLMHEETRFYDDLIDFNEARFPTVHKLA
jgi:hypothetical protein